MAPGFERKPGGVSLVQASSDLVGPGIPGKRSLTEQLPGVPGSAPSAKPPPAIMPTLNQGPNAKPDVLANPDLNTNAMLNANLGLVRSADESDEGTERHNALASQPGPRASAGASSPEVEFSEHLVAEMNQLNLGPHLAERGVHYAFHYKASFPSNWKPDYLYGFADPRYFVRVNPLDWRLKPNVSASAGIKAWLRGLTIADCHTAMIAIQTDVVRVSIGDDKFDQRFGSTDIEVPEDRRMRIKVGTVGTAVDGLNVKTDGVIANDVGALGHRPVKKGDWCYFGNHPRYLLKHPGGAFQGENAMSTGTNASGQQVWSGMGISNATEQDMLHAMVRAYNHARDEFDHEELARIKADNGGVLPSQYGEASGEYPLLTNPSEILNAPAYEINGVTRIGGFQARTPRRVDITKLAVLAP